MKRAILLYSLGGPNNLEAVRPYLFNLFSDPAILRLPNPWREMLAWLIATTRTREAKKVYKAMGGKSPLLEQTQAQARALQKALCDWGTVECFVAMRCWQPFIFDALRRVKIFNPDEIIHLPLYPQYSTTTTGSSFSEAVALMDELGLNVVPQKVIQAYPTLSGFIESMVAQIKPALKRATKCGKPRLLLSAHGLPLSIVKSGDPYQGQCEETARALIEKLGRADLDYVLCYQSKVGPMKWIEPSLVGEIDRAGQEKKPLVIAPIAFVSEHSETLYELGMLNRERATHAGVPFYEVVPTVGTTPAFINGLADLVRSAVVNF